MWVMTSKRIRGSYGNPPRVEFFIGSIKIADIVMTRFADGQYEYSLETFEAGTRETFETFSDALKELHRLLNSPP